MSLLDRNDLKEKQKLNKKLTRQKILLGGFLVDGLKKCTADNLSSFLTRQTDKDLMADLVNGLGGKVNIENLNETKADSETL